MTYNDAVLHAWLTDSEIAEFFSVKIQNVKRWKKLNKAPAGVVRALCLLAGDCPAGFEGWSFAGGFLWSPENVRFSPGQIRASVLDADVIKSLVNENQMLREKLAEKDSADYSNVVPFPMVNRRDSRAS